MKKLLFICLVLCLFVCLTACSEDVPEETTVQDGASEAESPKEDYTDGLIFSEENGGYSVIGYQGTDSHVLIPGTYNGLKVLSVGRCAFAGNSAIKTVTFVDNMERIGVSAFAGCYSLSSVYLPQSLKRIDTAAFYGCSSLTTLELPLALETVGVDAFGNCNKITNIRYDGNRNMWNNVEIAVGNGIFEEGLTLGDGEAIIKPYAAGNCNSSVAWQIGYDGVLSIIGHGHMPDYTFGNIPWDSHIDKITSIVIYDGIDIIGKNAFLGCVNVKSVTIPNSVRLIDDYAFYGCSSITEITLPDNLRRIGKSVFINCTSLRSITIPQTVTAIGSGAFMGCSALQAVSLSLNVTEIEPWTFANCPYLISINKDHVTSIGDNAFFGTNIK